MVSSSRESVVKDLFAASSTKLHLPPPAAPLSNPFHLNSRPTSSEAKVDVGVDWTRCVENGLYCSERFTTKHAFEDHQKLWHGTYIPYECKYCLKRFIEKREQTDHQKKCNRVVPTNLLKMTPRSRRSTSDYPSDSKEEPPAKKPNLNENRNQELEVIVIQDDTEITPESDDTPLDRLSTFNLSVPTITEIELIEPEVSELSIKEENQPVVFDHGHLPTERRSKPMLSTLLGPLHSTHDADCPCYECTYCNICNDSFNSRKGLLIHTTKMHPSEEDIRNALPNARAMPELHRSTLSMTRVQPITVMDVTVERSALSHLYHEGSCKCRKCTYCTSCDYQFATRHGLHIHLSRIHPDLDLGGGLKQVRNGTS